jgi:hypothetical protein
LLPGLIFLLAISRGLFLHSGQTIHPDCCNPEVFGTQCKWNDDSFHPIAPASTCHEDFTNATDCSFDTVNDLLPATAQKVKDALASFRTDLTRIIGKWETSGQGDGGHLEQSDDNDSHLDLSPPPANEVTTVPFGVLYRRSAWALTTRPDFLCGQPSYLLYFWDMADHHQLLQTSLQRFSKDSGASDALSTRTDITPAADSAQRRRQLHSKSAAVFSASVKSMIDAEQSRTVGRADRDDKRQQMKAASDDKRQRIQLESDETRLVKQCIVGLEDLACEFHQKYAEVDDINSQSALFYLAEANLIKVQIKGLQQTLVATPPTRK